jgi:hypothetical protein
LSILEQCSVRVLIVSAVRSSLNYPSEQLTALRLGLGLGLGLGLRVKKFYVTNIIVLDTLRGSVKGINTHTVQCTTTAAVLVLRISYIVGLHTIS